MDTPLNKSCLSQDNYMSKPPTVFRLGQQHHVKKTCYTAQMACTSLNPRPYRMFSVLMTSPGGIQVRGRCSVGAVCRRLALWGIDQEKVGGILVGNKRMKK